MMEFVQANLGIFYAAGWAVLIVAATEFVKPVIKTLIKSERWSKLAVRSTPFIFGMASGPVAAPIVLLKLFGENTNQVAGIAIGLGAGLAAQGLYSAFEEWHVMQVLKLRLYKLFGVTVKEVNEANVGLDGESWVEASYAEED